VGTANLLAGEVVERAGGACSVALTAGATIALPVACDGGRVVVSARPENLKLYPTPGPGRWPVELRIRMPVGAQTVSEVVTRSGESLKITEPRETLASPGDGGGALYCGIVTPSAVSIFPAPTPAPAPQ
jgi:hypothetical protein